MFDVVNDPSRLNDLLLRLAKCRNSDEVIMFPEEMGRENSFFLEVKNLALVLYCANNDIPCRVLLNEKTDIPEEILQAVTYSDGCVRVYRFRDAEELTTIADAINDRREDVE